MTYHDRAHAHEKAMGQIAAAMSARARRMEYLLDAAEDARKPRDEQPRPDARAGEHREQ